jgi:hypothetical protein
MPESQPEAGFGARLLDAGRMVRTRRKAGNWGLGARTAISCAVRFAGSGGRPAQPGPGGGAQPGQCAGGRGRGAACRRAAGLAALEALARFGGVKRRLELRGVRGVTVYDDFAHHPTAIAATIAGLRQRIGRRAHPGSAGAALQHHEAGRDEGATAGQPGRRPNRRSAMPPTWAGMSVAHCCRWATRRRSSRISMPWLRRCPPQPARGTMCSL